MECGSRYLATSQVCGRRTWKAAGEAGAVSVGNGGSWGRRGSEGPRHGAPVGSEDVVPRQGRWDALRAPGARSHEYHLTYATHVSLWLPWGEWSVGCGDRGDPVVGYLGARARWRGPGGRHGGIWSCWERSERESDLYVKQSRYLIMLHFLISLSPALML